MANAPKQDEVNSMGFMDKIKELFKGKKKDEDPGEEPEDDM